MVKLKCGVCGNEFHKYPSELKRIGSDPVCSNKCRAVLRMRGKKLICPMCGKEFYRKRAVLKRIKNPVCSRECHGKQVVLLQSGENSSAWSGGRVKDNNGYIRVLDKEHHRSDHNGYVYEHVIIAEKILGRRLKKTEVVHHINGVKDDNNEENLQVLGSHGDHFRIHAGYELVDGNWYGICVVCGERKVVEPKSWAVYRNGIILGKYCKKCWNKKNRTKKELNVVSVNDLDIKIRRKKECAKK